MDSQKDSLIEQLKPFRLVATIMISLVTLSTVFFHIVEKWNWLDSYYFTIITMGTVGYGDFTPKTPEGKIGATFLVIFGIGLFGIFANLLLKRRALKRLNKQERKG
jgi:voltage-gated potassium channel